MPKTIFARLTRVSAEFLNAINNPRFVEFPVNDGEIALVRDADLDQSAGGLLSRTNTFIGAFATTAIADTLSVSVGGGSLLLADGTPVTRATTQIGPLPASSTTYLWLDPTATFRQGSVSPTDGSVVFSRVTTDAARVTDIVDLRTRFRIGAENYTPPAIVGQIQGFAFPISDIEWIDEVGFIWLNPAGGLYFSRGGAQGSDADNDGYETLFKRMWEADAITLHNGIQTSIAKTSPQADWDAGRLLYIPPMANRLPVAAGGNFDVGDRGGSNTVALSAANNGQHSHVATQALHSHTVAVTQPGPLNGGSTGYVESNNDGSVQSRTTAAAAPAITVQNSGSGTPFSILNPYWAETRMIFTGARVV